MAEVSNMHNNNRVNLGEAIPLATPFVVQLEASGYCNLKCGFCPVNDESAGKIISKDMLSFDLFRKFIDQCSAFPQKIKFLRIIGIGEPLLNKDLPKMVAYGKSSGVFEKIEITSNGTLLNPSLTDALVDAQLDVLRISLEGIDDDTLFKVSKVPISVDKIRGNLSYFYAHRKNCILYIKTMEDSLPDNSSKQEFFDTYGAISDYIYVEKVIENWPGFSAGIETTNNVRYDIDAYKMHKEVCVQPFMLLCVGANGDVMPCCVDWARTLKLGNINKTSMFNIWNGEKLRDLRVNLLNKTKCKTCNSCVYPICNQADSIDDYSSEILQRISQAHRI